MEKGSKRSSKSARRSSASNLAGEEEEMDAGLDLRREEGEAKSVIVHRRTRKVVTQKDFRQAVQWRQKGARNYYE